MLKHEPFPYLNRKKFIELAYCHIRLRKRRFLAFSDAHRDPQAKEDAPGFALSVTDDKLEVSQMFESSRAERAGLLLGDEVVEIDGLSPPCLRQIKMPN